MPQHGRYCYFRAVKVLIIVLLPCLLGFSPQLIEDINIVAIRAMQLHEEQGQPVIVVRLIIRNSAHNLLKLQDCEFKLAIAPNDAKEILLGTARNKEIFLKSPDSSQENAFADTEVPITIYVKQSIQELAQTLMTTKEIALLLAEPAATVQLPVHLQGQFDLAVKATRSWGTQPGIRIDWIVRPQVEKQILTKLITAMTSGTMAEMDSVDPKTTLTQTPAKTPQLPSDSERQSSASVPSSSGQSPPSERTVVYFASGSTSLDLPAMSTLQEWAEQYQGQSQEFILHIEGHTDSSGSATLNQEISIQRAGAVYGYLAQTSNLTWKYVIIEGFGQTRLAMTGDSEEARRKNRRVEVYVQQAEQD